MHSSSNRAMNVRSSNSSKIIFIIPTVCFVLSAGRHPAAHSALCEFYVSAMRAGGAEQLLGWLPQVCVLETSTTTHH